jgi:thioredoxin-related protein
MKLKFLLMCVAFLVIQQLVAQEKASVILERAYDQAKSGNKNVFVIFHASWCSWCKRMDKEMNDGSCQELFSRNYVIAHLVVQESKNNKNLENPGALELKNEYKGEKSGIPFWLIFDNNGKLLADCFDSSGQNLGCPATKSEVDEFIRILKKTSHLSDKELSVIAGIFLSKN